MLREASKPDLAEKKDEVDRLEAEEWVRRNRLRRIQRQADRSVSSSTATALTVSSYFANLGNEIIQAFNPRNIQYFSEFGFSSWSSYLTKIPFLGLLGQWIETFAAAKRLYQAENKNIFAYFDFGSHLLSTLAWTAIYGFVVAGATAVIAPALPWITLGLGIFYGVVGLGKAAISLYEAYHATTSEERWEHLKNAGKHVLGIVINVCACVASFVLGVKMQDAANSMLDSISKSLKAAGKAVEAFISGDWAKSAEYEKEAKAHEQDAKAHANTAADHLDAGHTAIKILSFAAAAKVVISLTSLTKSLNVDTWNGLKNIWKLCVDPSYTRKEYFKYTTWKSVIKSTVTFPLRLISLPFAPLHGIAYGVKKACQRAFPVSKPAPVRQVASDKASNLTARINAQLSEYEKNKKRDGKLSRKDMAKEQALREILVVVTDEKKSEDNILGAMARAKEISPSVRDSFFKTTGRIQRIEKETIELVRMRAAGGDKKG